MTDAAAGPDDRPDRDRPRRAPRRHRVRRDAVAAPELDGRDRRAGLAAGLRGAPGGRRVRDARRRRVRARRVAVRAARRGRARDGAGACGRGIRNRHRAGATRSRSPPASSPRASGSPSRSASPSPRARRSPRSCARRFTVDAPVRRGDPVLHGARRRRARAQRHPGRRRRARARLDELPRPPRARDRRRHRARARGRERARRDHRGRLVHREVRLLPVRRPRLRRPAEPPRAAPPRVRRRPHRGRRHRRRLAGVRRRPGRRQRHLRGRARRPAPRRRPSTAWSTPEFDASAWPEARRGASAREGYEHVPVPEARIAPPVRRIDELPVAEVHHVAVGRRRSSTSARTSWAGSASRWTARRARASRCVTPRCSRTASSRSARCATPPPTDVLELAGDGRGRPGSRGSRSTASATPSIEGWPGEFDPADVTAVVLASDLPRTGWFESSHELLDRLHENVVLGHARQLPLDPHRLPAARRAPRLDGRHPGLRADRELPRRLRRVPRVVAARPRARAAPRARRGAARRAGGPAVVRHRRAHRRLGRRGDHRAVGALRALRRRGRAARRVPQHARLGRRRPRGHRAPRPLGRLDAARRLARPRRAARQAQEGEGRRRRRGLRLPRPLAADRRRCRRGARRGRRRRALRDPGRAHPCGVRRRVRHARRSHDERRDHRLRARPRLRPRDGCRAAHAPRGPPRRARARTRLPHRHGLRGHAARDRRADRGGTPLRRRAPAAADRVPVVALPRDDGRDHGVGALGQPAARRLGEPRRDDLVQPLRARRGRRLAAPHGRGPRTGCPRLPPHPDRAAAARRAGARARRRTARRTARPPSPGAARATTVVVTAEVPPNTEAVVDLPGSTPFVVGSGRHEWRFAERAGCREPPPVRPRLAERRHHRRPRGVPRAARHARRPRPRSRRGGARRHGLGRGTPPARARSCSLRRTCSPMSSAPSRHSTTVPTERHPMFDRSSTFGARARRCRRAEPCSRRSCPASPRRPWPGSSATRGWASSSRSRPALREDAEAQERFWAALAEVPDDGGGGATRDHAPAIDPDPDYEGDEVPRGSAGLTLPGRPCRGGASSSCASTGRRTATRSSTSRSAPW